MLTISYSGQGDGPFLALDEFAPRAMRQSRCAFGSPPHVTPLNVTATLVVCQAPAKPTPRVVRLRVSLNGDEFFDTGLDFQYYDHPQVQCYLVIVIAMVPSTSSTTTACRSSAT